MYIRLTRDYAGRKLGDVLNETDAIGRAYIEAGVAEESNADEHLTAMLRSEREETQRQFETKLKELETRMASAPSSGPPSRGMVRDDQGVPIPDGGAVTPGESSVDRGELCFGDMLNCIMVESSPRFEHSHRERSATRLRTHYSQEIRTYDRGGKPVERAGTESLTGGASYGYLVKPEFYGSLFEIAIEDSCFEPYTFSVPIGNSLELHWPALDQYLTAASGQSAAYAGVSVLRKGETDTRPKTDAKLRNITYKVTDLTGFTQLSRDLIADNYIAADAMIQRLFARAIVWKKDYEFLRGDGVGKPLGVLNSPALLSVTRDTASHIKYEDLIGMIAVMHASSWKKSMWLAHQSTYTDIAAISTHAGANTYAFQPNSSITQAMELAIMAQTKSTLPDMKFQAAGTLLGRPIYFTEKLPALGTTGCLLLVDPTQYGVATRMGLEVGISEHFLFDTDQIAFRFKIRNDGQPLWLSYYTDPTSTKYSPFVQVTQ